MTDLEDWKEEAYWRFSLGLYSRPGVAPSCLTLQDEWGVDVNVLLMALWAVSLHGRSVETGELAQAEARVQAWRDEIIRPLRTVRRRMKTGPAPAPGGGTEPLREQLKSIELRAEHVEQKVLADWALKLQGENASDGPSTEDYALTAARVVALYGTSGNNTGRERREPDSPGTDVYVRMLAEATVRYLATAQGGV